MSHRETLCLVSLYVTLRLRSFSAELSLQEGQQVGDKKWLR